MSKIDIFNQSYDAFRNNLANYLEENLNENEFYGYTDLPLDFIEYIAEDFAKTNKQFTFEDLKQDVYKVSHETFISAFCVEIILDVDVDISEFNRLYPKYSLGIYKNKVLVSPIYYDEDEFYFSLLDFNDIPVEQLFRMLKFLKINEKILLDNIENTF